MSLDRLRRRKQAERMAIEARPDQSPSESPQSAYQQLLAYGRDRGYKLDLLTARETFGSSVGSTTESGLLLQDIDQGPFAQAPDWRNNLTGRPRGSLVRPNAPTVGHCS